MYEMKDFEDGGMLLAYLNGLPPHEVITCQFDNNKYWRVIVKRADKVDAPKPHMVRPKGWKPGEPYVPMVIK